MTRIVFPFTLLATALVCLLPAAPALAGAARTFVSATGSDSNSCTNVATPCRHLAAAYAATAAGGEIYVLDPANYGSLTITGPVSIEGHGWASIAPVVNNPAITVNANPGDAINIIGVVLDGTAVGNTIGIKFNSGGTLTVRDSVIRNFTFEGIDFVPNSSSASQLNVSNTLLSDNSSYGIFINLVGSGAATAVFDNVEMSNNGNGLGAQTPGATLNVTVSNSVSASNGLDGILAQSNGGTVNVTVRDSTIANNGNDGVHAQNAGATIRITRSTITNNVSGWVGFVGGVVLSYSDNNIDDNGGVNSEPPNHLVYH